MPCDGSATLLDVRTAWGISGAIWMAFEYSLDDLREHLDELDRGKPVYELPDRASQLSGLSAFNAVWFYLCPSLRRIQFLSGRNKKEQQTAQSAYPCGMEKL